MDNVTNTVIRNIIEYQFVMYALTEDFHSLDILDQMLRYAKELGVITEEECNYLMNATALLPCR